MVYFKILFLDFLNNKLLYRLEKDDKKEKTKKGGGLISLLMHCLP